MAEESGRREREEEEEEEVKKDKWVRVGSERRARRDIRPKLGFGGGGGACGGRRGDGEQGRGIVRQSDTNDQQSVRGCCRLKWQSAFVDESVSTSSSRRHG